MWCFLLCNYKCYWNSIPIARPKSVIRRYLHIHCASYSQKKKYSFSQVLGWGCAALSLKPSHWVPWAIERYVNFRNYFGYEQFWVVVFNVRTSPLRVPRALLCSPNQTRPVVISRSHSESTVHSSFSDTKITHCFIYEYKNPFSREIKRADSFLPGSFTNLFKSVKHSRRHNSFAWFHFLNSTWQDRSAWRVYTHLLGNKVES